MTRLLFAAARGARIEKTNYDGVFRETMSVPLRDVSSSAYTWRIRPRDEHLQYGPTSTALREMAECAPDAINGYSPDYWYARDFKADTDSPYYMQDELHRSLFLLILAEALADEGL